MYCDTNLFEQIMECSNLLNENVSDSTTLKKLTGCTTDDDYIIVDVLSHFDLVSFVKKKIETQREVCS